MEKICGQGDRIVRGEDWSMNRVEFMRQLESLLRSIAPMEREEALQYYNDYFDDAGKGTGSN